MVLPVFIRRNFGLAAAAFAALALLGLDTGAALAQSASCAQLNATLQSLDSNGDFRNADRGNSDLRSLQANERGAESAYIRTGCQRDQQQGYPQTPQCRGLAKQILSQRAQIAQLTQSLGNADAVSQRREQVLQDIARFGCNQQDSQARFSNDGSGNYQAPRRRNFLKKRNEPTRRGPPPPPFSFPRHTRPPPPPALSGQRWGGPPPHHAKPHPPHG